MSKKKKPAWELYSGQRSQGKLKSCRSYDNVDVCSEKTDEVNSDLEEFGRKTPNCTLKYNS